MNKSLINGVKMKNNQKKFVAYYRVSTKKQSQKRLKKETELYSQFRPYIFLS